VPESAKTFTAHDARLIREEIGIEWTTSPLGIEQFQLRFRILDERGRTVRDFDVKNTKRLHLVVVRRDMINFQHLHPTLSPATAGWYSCRTTSAPTGIWSRCGRATSPTCTSTPTPTA
jgi:hypothetical protein